MNKIKIDVSSLVDLVKEIESEDPIDWGLLNIDEDDTVKLIALNILDQYESNWQHLSEKDFILAMLSIISKLVVENFTLNLKLLQYNEN